ncbi:MULTISPECIES: LysR family transcriptional regulator [unclassified Herbaspirillum]|uniref:LysR family transcriptional regulator n=1 Tax=unclassified Herbaspirillum TaxID=2624150 RepID=UPI00383B2CA4
MFDWENLRYFYALAQAGSLSAAARTLAVEHATVSRRVAALEAELGARLLERLPRKVELTETGRRVQALAAQIEEVAFGIERVIRAGQSDLRGRVVVSAPLTVVAHFLAPAAAMFRQRYPEIELVLTSESTVVSLTRREADLSLRLARPSEADYVAQPLGEMLFRLYASPRYPRLRRPRDWEFVAYDPDHDAYPLAREILKIAGTRTIALRVNDMSTQLAIAASGAGVAMLPCFLAEASADLVGVGSDAFALEVWLAVHGELKESGPIKAVRTFIAELMKSSGRLEPPRGRARPRT